GPELAVRRVAAAHIADHQRIATLDRMLKRGLLGRQMLAVRCAVDQNREATGCGRQPDVGAQHDAVAYRDRPIFGEVLRARWGAFLFRLRGKKQRTAQDRDGQRGKSNCSSSEKTELKGGHRAAFYSIRSGNRPEVTRDVGLRPAVPPELDRS